VTAKLYNLILSVQYWNLGDVAKIMGYLYDWRDCTLTLCRSTETLPFTSPRNAKDHEGFYIGVRYSSFHFGD
jgi:hypothetical protein